MLHIPRLMFSVSVKIGVMESHIWGDLMVLMKAPRPFTLGVHEAVMEQERVW